MADSSELMTYIRDEINSPDQWQQAPEEPNIRSTSSRDWSNRKAKKEAKVFAQSIDPFDQAWSRVLKAEGGFTVDTGGATKYGVSQNAYPHLDIANITPEMARDIYRKDYYEASGADVIGRVNPALAEHVADMAYNAGTGTAIKLLYKSVGMTPQKGISEELVQRLSSDESMIRDYSQQRLGYYTGLAERNPDKYGKYLNGWTNRVRNLNKELGFGKGMNDLYKASKNLDTRNLDVLPILRPFAPQLQELSNEDKKRLMGAGQQTSSLYTPDPSVVRNIPNKPISGLGDVLSASFNQQYYLNTESGARKLQAQAGKEALEANLNSLGKQVSSELYGQISSAGSFEEGMKTLREYFPDVKVPYANSSQVRDFANTKAQEIERQYAELESGSFTNGVGEAANKLLHIVAGYLPGSIVGSLADPKQAVAAGASAIAAGATGGASVPAQAAIAAAVEAALQGGLIQPGVQEERGNLGLEHGFKQGLENTAMAAGASGLLQGAGAALAKWWNKGSNEAARAALESNSKLAEVAKTIPDSSDKAIVEMAVKEADSVANMYAKNPFGDSIEGKLKLEAELSKVAQDVAQDLKPRDTGTLPTYTGPMAQEDADFISGLGGKSALDEWENFKKGFISSPIKDDTGTARSFNTFEEAQAFLDSPEGSQFKDTSLIRQRLGRDQSFYLTEKDPSVIPAKPEISQDRPLTIADQVLQAEDEKFIKAHLQRADTDIDRMLDNTLIRLENHPDPIIKELLVNDDGVKEMLTDIKSEKLAQQELLGCMFGDAE